MKNPLLIVLLVAALALLAVSLFSTSGPELGLLKLDLLELRQENQDLARRFAEAQEEIAALSGQLSFLEAGSLPASARVSPPSASELLAAAGAANAASLGTANSGSTTAASDFLSSPPTPAQAAWLNSAVRETLRTQAEDQRKRVLDAQVQFVRSKLDEVAEKMKLQGMQKDQLAQVVENYIRSRSDIRGTRGWWEYSTEEWDGMRARLKETEKHRNEQIAQILMPEQIKELKQWEKKRPGWFNPGSNFNPRGSDF